jgi:hypothetical protein
MAEGRVVLLAKLLLLLLLLPDVVCAGAPIAVLAAVAAA